MINPMKFARKCTECGCGMNDGYVVGGGVEYYCSQNCLNKEFTDAEWHDMVYSGDTDEDGELIADTDSYWTEWEDEDDYQYVVKDGELVEID
jgi:hypothetical protein